MSFATPQHFLVCIIDGKSSTIGPSRMSDDGTKRTNRRRALRSANDPKRKLGLVHFWRVWRHDVFLECEGLPRGVPTSDTARIAKFAALVEAG